jgi:CelD/BcsL family acetyltransferase involved in cellulose biosynthesis
MLATTYLKTLGKSLTIALQDGEKFVAAELCIVHRRELVFWSTFRNRDYDYHGVGNRTMELAYHWARDNGLLGIDIGGSFVGGVASYKGRWAPQSGAKATLLISPFIQYAEDRVHRAMSSAWGAVTRIRGNLLGSAKRD